MVHIDDGTLYQIVNRIIFLKLKKLWLHNYHVILINQIFFNKKNISYRLFQKPSRYGVSVSFNNVFAEQRIRCNKLDLLTLAKVDYGY